ncbi:tRNA-modifying enzyme [Candidatus Woesearchaeota archaeon RBG_13_36_6]|nr:MAG: tRNA-modifying enzyme [Candidatus Woesearchaeota archaeon RBG_13_36_6]
MQKWYQDLKQKLKKQHYGIVGNHSAVKLCGWTKKSLLNQGFCYKQKFYGIRSHLCCQMTPSVGFCQNNCIYCWREVEYSIANQFKVVDDPKLIFDESIKAQKRLMSGFGGTRRTNMKKLREAQNPMHYAISLSGEPTMYPRLSELIKLLKKNDKTTFLVSNGMLPEVIANLEMPTQLYISVDAPDEKHFKKISKPLYKDSWQRLNKTLDVLKKLRKKTRTTLRLTMIKEINMLQPDKYAELIEKANPKFVEIKAYMFVGTSRQRMTLANMPYHKDIVDFAQQIEANSDYKFIDEKEESRVVLMMKKDTKDRVMEFD